MKTLSITILRHHYILRELNRSSSAETAGLMSRVAELRQLLVSAISEVR